MKRKKQAEQKEGCPTPPGTAVGRLDKALDRAKAKGWKILRMKDDWKTIFPPANK